MEDLQDDIAKWHRAKYPDATLADLGVKLAEETGEVCKALDRIRHAKTTPDMDFWLSNLADELGDVTNVVLALHAKIDIDFESNVTARAQEVMARE